MVVERLLGAVFGAPFAVRNDEFESVALVVVRIRRADLHRNVLRRKDSRSGLGHRHGLTQIPTVRHRIAQYVECSRVIRVLRRFEAYHHRREVDGNVVYSGSLSHQQGIELIAALRKFPAAVTLLSVVVVESLLGAVFGTPFAVRNPEFESVAFVVVRIGRADVDVHAFGLEYPVACFRQGNEVAEVPARLRSRAEEEQRFGIGGRRAAREGDFQGVEIDAHGIVAFAEPLVARDEADVAVTVALFLKGPVFAGRLVADILRPVVEIEFEAALRLEINVGVLVNILPYRQQGIRLDHVPAVLHVVAQDVERRFGIELRDVARPGQREQHGVEVDVYGVNAARVVVLQRVELRISVVGDGEGLDLAEFAVDLLSVERIAAVFLDVEFKAFVVCGFAEFQYDVLCRVGACVALRQFDRLVPAVFAGPSLHPERCGFYHFGSVGRSGKSYLLRGFVLDKVVVGVRIDACPEGEAFAAFTAERRYDEVVELLVRERDRQAGFPPPLSFYPFEQILTLYVQV